MAHRLGEAVSLPRPRTVMGRRAGWRLLLGLVICYSAVHLGYSLWRYRIWGRDASTIVYGADVRRPWMEAKNWKAGKPLLLRDVIYPPLYYALMVPWTNLEYRVVEPIFYVSQFLWYLLAIWLMVKTAFLDKPPPVMAYVVATALMVNFHPFLETVALYKVEGLEVFLICLAIYAFKHHRDVAAGMIIVVAANLKYLPGILILYFLVKREWRVILGMLIGAVLLVGLLLPMFGAKLLWDYASYPAMFLFDHSLWGTGAEASLEFQTLTGTVNRWFAGFAGMRENLSMQRYAPVLNPRAAFLIIGTLKACLVGFYLYLIRHRWPPEQRRARWPSYLYEVSLTLIMIFIISPISLIHYGILLLPAFVMVGLIFYQQAPLFRLKEKLLFAAAYALTAVIIPGGVWNRLLPPHPVWGERHAWVYFWLSFPFYGYLLLGACILLCLRRLQHAEWRQPERAAHV